MDFAKHALILAMIEGLRAHGNRTGKTHVIKGLFLGKAAGVLEVPFDFFLYKHGPYSTDVEENLEEMISYGAVAVDPAFDGYGVILRPGEKADFAQARAPLRPETREGIGRICQFIQGKNAGQLERLATAAWIRTVEGIQQTDEVASRLNLLKPHVNLQQARESDEELRCFLSGNESGQKA